MLNRTCPLMACTFLLAAVAIIGCKSTAPRDTASEQFSDGSGLTSTPQNTPLDLATAIVPTTPATHWTAYTDPEWHFSLAYPSRLGERALHLVRGYQQVPEGPERLLLLSDSLDAIPQDWPPDETVRVSVWRQDAEGLIFEEWSALMSVDFADELPPTSVGTCRAFMAESRTDADRVVVARWIDASIAYWGVTIESAIVLSEAVRIADSFVPQECD